MSVTGALARTVAAYVPSCLVRQILDGHLPVPGQSHVSQTAVLFADISGFTPMSEALAQIGRQGAEELTRHLNATFSATIAQVTAYGGDIAVFGGDAILAFFTPVEGETSQAVAWRALTCALAMRRAMQAFAHVETVAGPFSLRMKFGLSFGAVLSLNVGSMQHGLEFVIAGTPVDQAAGNENYAASDQVVADASLLDWVGDRATVAPLSPQVLSHRGLDAAPAPLGTRRVLDVVPAPPQALPPIDYERLDADTQRMLIDTVSRYLPPKLYEELCSKASFSGDHRPVTSLFVNFAGPDYARDPQVGQKLQTYITQAQTIIHRYDGNLNRVLTGDKGNQLHVIFGAPIAHEDDKARALRCALVLQRELGALPFIKVQRIGLASGYVFAGPVGAVEQSSQVGVARSEYTVMGDIVNLSARLTGVCPPGQVVADAYTRSRTAQRFEFQPFGPVQLKGKKSPVTPYEVKGERVTENALVTRYLLSRRRIVGRHKELAVIERAITAALDERGQILAVTGQAGVGKSRLIEEAVRRWLEADGVGYGGDCVSHSMEVPYWPWADLWRAQFDLHENDTPQERLDKILHCGQSLGLDLGEWAALVAGLLGLPTHPDGETHPALAPLDPQARHRRLLDLTTELVVAQAQQAPILLLFEDLHWADRASLELVDHVAEHIVDQPMLLCLVYRPREPFPLVSLKQPFCHTLQLGELSDQEGAILVRSILGDIDLPPAFMDEVNAKTQGNPLFVEELINSLIDIGLLQKENSTYRVVGALEEVEIPDTIEAVLLARMDRLETPNRDLLRVASVIGRQFAYGVLRGIYPYTMGPAEMQERLSALEQLDLTRLERPEPELEYLFKHALTQDVAYKNLAFALRRSLHERIARFLETHYRDHLETIYGTLAHHFARGGQPEQALSYALAAGAQARSLFANDEALAYYHQAERLLNPLPAQTFKAQAIRLYLERGQLYTLLGNFDQAEGDLQHGAELAVAASNPRAQAQALNGLAYLRYWQTHNEAMLRLARQALTLAETGHYRREAMMALRYVAMAYEELGDHDQAVTFFTRARTLAEELDDRQALSTIHMGIAVSAFNQGRLRHALDALERLLIIYRESGDKHRASDCLSNIANTRYYLGEFQSAHAAFEESIRIDREIGKRAGLAYGLRDLGGLHCHQGRYAAGLAAMQEAAAIFDEIDDKAGRAWCDLALGREYYLDVGHQDKAAVCLRCALPVLQAGESHEEVAEALLGLGRLDLQQGRYIQAQTHLERALALCQSHRLRWRQPEAYARLAELALSQGQAEQAQRWAQQTFDAIAAGGCPDLAPSAHLVLAQVTSNSLGHYDLAVETARQRSRCIDLARTLHQAGRYLGTQETRYRRQGQAYLREAQALVENMGLSPDILSLR